MQIEIERLKMLNSNKLDTDRHENEVKMRDISHKREREKLLITSKLEMIL